MAYKYNLENPFVIQIFLRIRTERGDRVASSARFADSRIRRRVIINRGWCV